MDYLTAFPRPQRRNTLCDAALVPERSGADEFRPISQVNFQNFLLVAPILLFSMVAHEYAHGYAAKRQGDDTADRLGRLTWNPIVHIDLFMTILLPLMTWFGGGFIFGGAKPVPVDPSKYRDLRRGDIIVSLAGVASNMVLAVLLTAIIVPLGLLGRAVPVLQESCAILQQTFILGVFFNLLLALFNLIPIPPLDGSHVLKYLLPPSWAIRYQQIGRYGLLIFIVLLTFGRPVLLAWLQPVYAMARFAQQLVFPYIIPSQLLS